MNTLRFRLAVWNAVVVLLTAAVTLAGLRQGVHWAIVHEMDQILSEDIQEIALALQQLPKEDFNVVTDELSRKAIGHRHHGWFMQLLDHQHQPVWSSTNTPELEQMKSATHTPYPLTLGNYRVVSRLLPGNPSQISSVRVGVALQFLKDEMNRIDRLMLMTILFMMLAAPLVGYLLARRAARALGHIIETAQRLRPDHLEERLPVRGNGDELDQLAITVNGLLDQIAEDLEQKKTFLADAAHELRTPLAGIRSAVEIALTKERTPAQYQELLAEIIDQGIGLEVLVNQLLLISETETKSLEQNFQSLSLTRLVKRSCEMFTGVAELREITLTSFCPSEIFVEGHPHMLRQVINNLLDNAIKYTPRGGKIQVELLADFSQNKAIFRVADTGIGVPEKELPFIFDRFYRTDKSRTRMSEAQGLGLGLSICQAVVEAHQGDIYCSSVVDQGSTFIVALSLDTTLTASASGSVTRW